MSMTDPIADMLTRIRNAQTANHKMVEMPFSKLKNEISRVMKREGFITDYVVEGGIKKTLRVYLKYQSETEGAIEGIRRESKSGLRKYASADEIPKVLGGMGVTIMSTSSGIMTGREARKKHVGGEVLCSIW